MCRRVQPRQTSQAVFIMKHRPQMCGDCSGVARTVPYSGMKLHTKRFILKFTDLFLRRLPKLEKSLRFSFLYSENQNTQYDIPVFPVTKHRPQHFYLLFLRPMI